MHLFIQPFHARSQAMLFEMFINNSNLIHVILKPVLLQENMTWNIKHSSRYKAILLQTLSVTQDITLNEVHHVAQQQY